MTSNGPQKPAAPVMTDAYDDNQRESEEFDRVVAEVLAILDQSHTGAASPDARL